MFPVKLNVTPHVDILLLANLSDLFQCAFQLSKTASLEEEIPSSQVDCFILFDLYDLDISEGQSFVVCFWCSLSKLSISFRFCISGRGCSLFPECGYLRSRLLQPCNVSPLFFFCYTFFLFILCIFHIMLPDPTHLSPNKTK